MAASHGDVTRHDTRPYITRSGLLSVSSPSSRRKQAEKGIHALSSQSQIMAGVLSLTLVVWIIFTSTSWYGVDAASEKDWVMISRCQATCLVEFGASLPEQTQDGCSQDDNCYMCWEVCEKLILDTVSWAPVCQTTESPIVASPPGYQTSCAFMLSLDHGSLSPDFSSYTYPDPVDVIIEDEFRVTLTWRTPVLKDDLQRTSNVPLVYAAFWRVHANSKWQRFASTTGYAAHFEGLQHFPVGLQFKVAAITTEGVIATDTPFYTAPEALHEDMPVPATPAPAEVQVEVELVQGKDGGLTCSVEWSSVAGIDYVVSWNREECHSEKGCDQPHGPWAIVFESLSEHSSLILPGITYSAEYWVELRGAGTTNKVYFFTPRCDIPTSPDLSVCKKTATTPSLVAEAKSSNIWYQPNISIVTGVGIVLLLLVVAMAATLLRNHSSLKETIISRAASLRSRSKHLHHSLRRSVSGNSAGGCPLKAKHSAQPPSQADSPLLSDTVLSSSITSELNPIFTASTSMTSSHCQVRMPIDTKKYFV